MTNERTLLKANDRIKKLKSKKSLYVIVRSSIAEFKYIKIA